MTIKNAVLNKMRDAIDITEAIEEDRKLAKRVNILNSSPNAPVCLLCRWCYQQGFLFWCIISEELVYYKRKNFSKSYEPMFKKESDCANFESLIPLNKERVKSLVKLGKKLC